MEIFLRKHLETIVQIAIIVLFPAAMAYPDRIGGGLFILILTYFLWLQDQRWIRRNKIK